MNSELRIQRMHAWMPVALLIACAACSRPQAPASTPAPAAAQPAGPVTVDVVAVAEQPLNVELSLPAELSAFQAVDIYPRVSGFVKSIAVDRGSTVNAGALLMVIDAPELVAERSEAEARVQAAQSQAAAAQARADADRATFDRLTSASATPGVVAGNDVAVAGKTADASRNQLAAAQQATEAARQALASVREREQYLRVTAPFAGVITERTVHPGALVGPSTGGQGAPALRLVDTRRLRLVVPVPEAYTSNITDGASIGSSVAAYPGRVFSGTVSRVARTVDATSRTMAVELDVKNSDGQLAPGTFCQVRWPIHRPTPSLFVPSTSIATTTDRTFVVRVRNGKTEWVDVRTGLTSGSQVEVFGALAAGDRVASRGTDELRAGTPVQTREAKAGTS